MKVGLLGYARGGICGSGQRVRPNKVGFLSAIRLFTQMDCFKEVVCRFPRERDCSFFHNLDEVFFLCYAKISRPKW
jgi:hypothetical protein